MVLIKDVIKENEELKQMLENIWWMAKRYADGRSTYATTDINTIIDKLRDKNIITEPDPIDNSYYAKDGNFGSWIKDLGFDYKPIDNDK